MKKDIKNAQKNQSPYKYGSQERKRKPKPQT